MVLTVQYISATKYPRMFAPLVHFLQDFLKMRYVANCVDFATRFDTSVPATVRFVFITTYVPWETTEAGRRSSSTKRLAMAPLASSPGSAPLVTEEKSSLSQRCVTKPSAAMYIRDIDVVQG